MGRAKLNLRLIPNAKQRNLTFKKRKEGILKKMKEFTTLCDVNACIIIYGPQSSEPTIWPPQRSAVERMIDAYKEKGSDNGTRSYGLPDFYMGRKKKVEGEVKKLKQKKLEAKYPTCPELLDGLSKPELESFVSFLNGKLRASNSRLEMINGMLINDNHIKQSQEEPLLLCHFHEDDYLVNNNNINFYDPNLENLGFGKPLQQVMHVNNCNVRHPNGTPGDYPINYYGYPTVRMTNVAAAHPGGGGLHYGDENGHRIGYGQQQEINCLYDQQASLPHHQYYMDRRTMQLAVAPPAYMGGSGDLPPLPPSCYFGSSLTSFYLEEEENQSSEITSALLPAIAAAGNGCLPQFAAYHQVPAAGSSSSSFNRYYQVTNQIKRY
ncbi:unnamed protein product [Cuscuta campestris]|uniref:MADS-box domain-containing protein n=1 Tax=Cuscuta campestris TaxID=132261 RepID=A0A484L694_9ASTE|nr:unnamed protein product [Cuscuta campestris]